jgi:hypothetical protein
VFGDLPAMDSDDEYMSDILFDEEAKAIAADAEREHMEIMGSLLAMYAQDAKPRHGGSKLGRRKSNAMQRIEGYCMLYANYFADDPIHGDVVFRRRFHDEPEAFPEDCFGS